MESTETAPSLNRPRQIKYWLRCLKTFLPTDYTSTDLNRLTLAFFCVSALDLLGELENLTTAQERQGWCDWVYKCQLPAPYGGFRGSPGTSFEGLGPGGVRNEKNEFWDPANLPAGYFALAMLVILGDDLSRVRRKELLALLPKLQRDDGSFGEWLGEGGKIIGGDDMRFVYCAVACRWMLNGGNKENEADDMDVDACVRFIESVITYDHGISAKPFGEAHGGYTYCALGALSLLGRLHPTHEPGRVQSPEKFVRWLVQRQMPYLEEEEGEDGAAPSELRKPHTSDASPLVGGFHGRCNKKLDTCYSFWVGGGLDILGKAHLIHVDANRRFLLEKTQHHIGGFSKVPDPSSPPDILHSFMGLAALSIHGEPGLLKIDTALCMTLRAKERFTSLPWWKTE